MVRQVIFDNEIALYWEKQWKYPDGIKYCVFVNGEKKSVTKKTHFELKDLMAEAEYAVKLVRLDEENKIIETLFDEKICTKKSKKRIDITKEPYCAVGDGKTLNTACLQKALNDCGADECVYFPKGTYLTGALDVGTETEIYLDIDAVLLGSKDVKDYEPKTWVRFEGMEMLCYRSLLNIGEMDQKAVYNRKNIVVRGGGKIVGGGVDLCWSTIFANKDTFEEEFLRRMKNTNSLLSAEDINIVVPLSRSRPRLIFLTNTENVVIANVGFEHSPCWNLHLLYSKNIITYNCNFHSDGVWNGDGWDPESSENCTIFGCRFQTSDDAIAIKSGKNLEGYKIGRPTRNICIFDCSGIDGISIGSELSGGVENVRVWDCSFGNGERGFRIKTNEKRGGYVSNIKVRNCVFSRILITKGYGCNNDGESTGVLTKVENVHFENVASYGRLVCLDRQKKGYRVAETNCLCVEGFEEENAFFKNITFKNVRIRQLQDQSIEPVRIKNVKGITIKNLEVFLGEA